MIMANCVQACIDICVIDKRQEMEGQARVNFLSFLEKSGQSLSGTNSDSKDSSTLSAEDTGAMNIDKSMHFSGSGKVEVQEGEQQKTETKETNEDPWWLNPPPWWMPPPPEWGCKNLDYSFLCAEGNVLILSLLIIKPLIAPPATIYSSFYSPFHTPRVR
jgi:hypothetical protein